MCGRFYVAGDRDEQDEALHALIAEAQSKCRTPIKTGEVFPGDTAAVIGCDRALNVKAFGMLWGMPRFDNKGAVINARSETADRLKMFSESSRLRRLVVPVSCYYEWEKRDGRKYKYGIWQKGENLTLLCGLYAFDENGAARFVILTRDAASDIGFIHSRMPLILPKDALSDWLSHDVDYRDMLKAAVTDMEYKSIA